jgi:Tfp pilus assembly protein PilW
MNLSRQKASTGFTLVEMMVSLGCGSLILAALMAGSVALQRSFAAVEGYSTTQGNQLRVLDYIAMDCRRAIPGFVPNSSIPTPSVASNTLTLTVPQYYKPNGTSFPPAFNFPINNAVSYNWGATNTIQTYTIQYSQSGSNFVRTVGPTAGWPTGNTATAIATNVSTFTVSLQDLTSTSTVSCSIMFFPTFLHNTGSGTWRSGGSAPGNGTGVNGDWYVIDPTASDPTTVGNVYFNSGGTYSLLENIKATTVYCNTFLRNAGARQ